MKKTIVSKLSIMGSKDCHRIHAGASKQMKPILFLGRTGLLACPSPVWLASNSRKARPHSVSNSANNTRNRSRHGWAIPCAAVPGHDQNCDYNDGVRPPEPVHLEPVDQLQVMFRIEDNHVTKIRPISGDCQLDADGVPLRWIRDVRPAESIAFLESFVTSDTEHRREGAVAAIALHADPAADAALERLPRRTSPSRCARKPSSGWARRADGAGMETCAASSPRTPATASAKKRSSRFPSARSRRPWIP